MYLTLYSSIYYLYSMLYALFHVFCFASIVDPIYYSCHTITSIVEDIYYSCNSFATLLWWICLQTSQSLFWTQRNLHPQLIKKNLSIWGKVPSAEPWFEPSALSGHGSMLYKSAILAGDKKWCFMIEYIHIWYMCRNI